MAVSELALKYRTQWQSHLSDRLNLGSKREANSCNKNRLAKRKYINISPSTLQSPAYFTSPTNMKPPLRNCHPGELQRNKSAKQKALRKRNHMAMP